MSSAQAKIITYALAQVTRSSGRLIRPTKPIRQEKVNGLRAPFCRRQGQHRLREQKQRGYETVEISHLDIAEYR